MSISKSIFLVSRATILHFGAFAGAKAAIYNQEALSPGLLSFIPTVGNMPLRQTATRLPEMKWKA